MNVEGFLKGIHPYRFREIDGILVRNEKRICGRCCDGGMAGCGCARTAGKTDGGLDEVTVKG